MEHAKHTKITTETRDAILKLNDAGIKLAEIAEILNVSYSSAAYAVQCYKAAESEDWETLRRLSTNQSSVVSWALNKAGKTMPEDSVDATAESAATIDTNALVMYEGIIKALNGIESKLSEILAELKG